MPDTPKGKPPSFPFYPGDWLREVTLRKSCLATRGAWADLLSFMWLEQTWQWEGTTKELARCLGTTTAAAYRAAKELIDNGVADGSVSRRPYRDVTLCNKNDHGCKADVTLISRRLYRLFHGRELTAARVREHRKRHSNDGVTAENTVPSSPSPSADRNTTGAASPPAFTFAGDLMQDNPENDPWHVTAKFHERMSDAFPHLDLITQYKQMVAWLEGNPKNRKTPRGMGRFVRSWLGNTQNRGHDAQGSPREDQREAATHPIFDPKDYKRG